MDLLGVKLVGMNEHTLNKLLLTIGLFVAVVLLRKLLLLGFRALTGANKNERFVFWVRQALSLMSAVLIVIAALSIWFDNPARLTTVMGLFTAGLAFALQKVITSFAGYIVIIRGKTFSVGDRITMGGVRGDVIALGFIQTTIMEMGQPPSVEDQAKPAMWVHGRQFTGRIVTVSNDKIFDEPIYNFTREFPYIWDEMTVPIGYKGDRKRAEQILLQTAEKHTRQYVDESMRHRERLRYQYFLDIKELEPRVYFRITDNWIEMSLRFFTPERGVREIKDVMSREIIDEFERADIEIASSTYDVVGFPPLKVDLASAERLAQVVQHATQPEHSTH